MIDLGLTSVEPSPVFRCDTVLKFHDGSFATYRNNGFCQYVRFYDPKTKEHNTVCQDELNHKIVLGFPLYQGRLIPEKEKKKRAAPLSLRSKK